MSDLRSIPVCATEISGGLFTELGELVVTAVLLRLDADGAIAAPDLDLADRVIDLMQAAPTLD
jgi:hypothetical protein